MTKEEIAKHFGLCNCDKIYTSRGLTAPDCPWHAFAVEEAMDEYARQEVIAFNRYCGGLPIDFHNRHTLEELYDLYQQQKTQP